VTTPTGQTATATASASSSANFTTDNVPTGNLTTQLRAGGRAGGITIGASLAQSSQDVVFQARQAEATATATNTAVPAAPNPPPPIANTTDPATPTPAPETITPSVTVPLPVSGDEAIDAANEAELAQLREAEGNAIFAPLPVSGDEAIDAANEAELAQLREAEGNAIFAPSPVESVFDPGLPQPSADFFANPDADAERAAAGAVSALRANAQQQNTLQNRVSLPASADWRVRLSLAQNANYLYRDPSVMLLQPLARTNGVVFPYTPNIDMNYAAKYDSVDLTHSNYRGHFYRSSSVDSISIRGTFTAQDTREAQYLLAVITFFKSVTKMFYGATDPLAGTPPPLVFLSGLGQFQFNNHPCVVSNFQYNLPGEVDYIRANGFNNYGLNMDNRRNQSSGPPASGLQGAIATVNRLLNNKLVQGALGGTGSTQSNNSAVSQNNSNTNYTNSTYVPTKMEINLTLLPIQTRSQISTQFDLKKFAAGDLLQQGFW
jgi:hypothetical protein